MAEQPDHIDPVLNPHNLRPCEPGAYPWDGWEERAKSAGVVEELAQLGRSLIREAMQHNWDAGLQNECGWSDDGEAMIALALSDPAAATERWEHLLRTDGERGYLNESGQWISL